MRFKLSFIVIPAITLCVAFAAWMIAKSEANWAWYKSLNLPPNTPSDLTFFVVWSLIFFATSIAAIIAWNSFSRTGRFWAIIGLFAANAALNLMWTVLFFGSKMIFMALITAILLEVITVVLTFIIALRAPLIALLLTPYVMWGGFEVYLNYLIWQLN